MSQALSTYLASVVLLIHTAQFRVRAEAQRGSWTYKVAHGCGLVSPLPTLFPAENIEYALAYCEVERNPWEPHHLVPPSVVNPLFRWPPPPPFS